MGEVALPEVPDSADDFGELGMTSVKWMLGAVVAIFGLALAVFVLPFLERIPIVGPAVAAVRERVFGDVQGQAQQSNARSQPFSV